MATIYTRYGRAIGPEMPMLIASQRRREAEIARAVRKHGVDGVCRVCSGIGFAASDGIYQACWACFGEGGRTAATVGAFTA